MNSEGTVLHEVLITGPGPHLSAPEWAKHYSTRVLSQRGLGRLASLPLLTIVRAGQPEALLAHPSFLSLLVTKWQTANAAAIVLLEFATRSSRLLEQYARVVKAFPSTANLELAFGPLHAASALVEAEAKIMARVERPAAAHHDPLSHVRRVIESTGDLRVASGRLSAERVAGAFGISVAALADIVHERRQTVSKSPDAESRQAALVAFERIARLRAVLSEEEFRKWLRIPNDDLGGAAPLGWLREGKAAEVADLADDMLTGTSS